MPFQLHIRQNLEAARDHFGPGQVRTFTDGTVRIGSDAACECRLDGPEFAPCQVILEVGAGRPGAVTARPGEGSAGTYLNQSPLDGPAVLRSGDQLRVGHWTLRFLRLHGKAERSRAFQGVAWLAKAAIVAILAAEVAIVAWLPRHLHQMALWQSQIARHRVVDVLDRLDRANRKAQPVSGLEREVRLAVGRELKRRADYITEYGAELGAERTRLLYDELLGFERVLEHLAAGTLPPPLPTLDRDAGVQALLAARRQP